MRQSLARFSEPESSPQIRSLADFIVTTSEFKLSVHTGDRTLSFTSQDGPGEGCGPAEGGRLTGSGRRHEPWFQFLAHCGRSEAYLALKRL